MTMKLIDTHAAGDILGVHYSRVRTLVRQGHLKDYNEVKAGAKKHYMKLSVTEVRELKKTHYIGKRTVHPKHSSSNGNAPVVIVPKKIQAAPEVSAVHPTVVWPAHSPIKSISERLNDIDTKITDLTYKIDGMSYNIEQLLKLWS